MTIEELQKQVLDLTAERDALKTERDTLSQKNSELSTNLESAREMNQRLFERVQQGTAPTPDPETPKPQTCEEFARTLKL